MANNGQLRYLSSIFSGGQVTFVELTSPTNDDTSPGIQWLRSNWSRVIFYLYHCLLGQLNQ